MAHPHIFGRKGWGFPLKNLGFCIEYNKWFLDMLDLFVLGRVEGEL